MLKEIDASYLLGTIINPLSGYFLCNLYLASEINPESDDYVDYKHSINIPYNETDLLTTKDYSVIKNNDIILVQVRYFDLFYNEILPTLGEKKIILITSQWAYPALSKSKQTDEVLNHKNIILWISQNPIYQHKKYMPFPFGINMKDLSLYYSFLVKFYHECDEESKCTTSKNINILETNLTVYDWYPENHIRKKYSQFGKESPKRIAYIEYLNKLSRSRYIISPQGDRPDCYRNYEALGLGCRPISNLNQIYREIFQENLLYASPETMLDYIKTKHIDINFSVPERQIILFQFWRDKIISKIKQL